jgi:hypothetical protein
VDAASTIKSPLQSRFSLGVSLFVAGIFVTAAISKLFTFSGFVSSIDSSLLLGRPASSMIAGLVIALELCSIFLLVSRLRPTIAILVTGLCGAFIGCSAWRWSEKIPNSCNCFGILLTMPPWAMILLNLFLLVALTWLRQATDSLRKAKS